MTWKIFSFVQYDETWLALLMSLGFESFQEEEGVLDAYVHSQWVDKEWIDKLDDLCKKYNQSYTLTDLEDKNWNEAWESSFQPVVIGDFCAVIAGFHTPPNNVKHIVRIDPKMAFGTGHHETTSMIIQMMGKIDFSAKMVLDYGCGTGILAILAEKCGATMIYAIDNDPAAYENTIENLAVNGSQKINTMCGVLADVTYKQFDIVLANINRNVLLSTGREIISKLKPGGILILSGILQQDEDLIKSTFLSFGCRENERQHKGDWVALSFAFPPIQE